MPRYDYSFLKNSIPGNIIGLTDEFIKKLFLAWDPDFTKLTAEERELLEKAENSEFIDETDIDWDNLDKIV